MTSIVNLQNVLSTSSLTKQCYKFHLHLGKNDGNCDKLHEKQVQVIYQILEKSIIKTLGGILLRITNS